MNNQPNIELHQLRVKITSLSYEARVIKRKEKTALRHYAKAARYAVQHNMEAPPNFWFTSLYKHRLYVVRPEARAAQLASVFIRGRDYRTAEPTAKKEPDWSLVRANVKRFATPSRAKEIDAWIKEAQTYFNDR